MGNKYVKANLSRIAREIAKSGGCMDSRDIEIILRTEYGCPNAKVELDSTGLRGELNELCKHFYKEKNTFV